MPEFSFPAPDSPWFLPFFLVMWLAITGLLAQVSGWASLATRFRRQLPVEGKTFRFASASMGLRWFPVSYGACLRFVVGPIGMRVSIWLPFRLLSPPLFFPWSQVESVVERRFLFMRSVVVRFVGHWSQMRVSGRVAKSILEAHVQALPTRGL